MQNENIQAIKKNIECLVGEKIRLETNKGRKKISVREGVLENTYPNIFVVRIVDENVAERIVSYTYTDVLTRTVQISTYDRDGNLQAC